MTGHESGIHALSDEKVAQGSTNPGSQANEIPGCPISFCGHCGQELPPQKTRRGHPKRFCNAACRSHAWRHRRNPSRPEAR
jgi:hypothetical protein